MLTIDMLIKLLLPHGSNPDPSSLTEVDLNKIDSTAWDKFPVWAPDLFATVAFLTKRTGAYTYVRPGIPYEPKQYSHTIGGRNNSTDVFGIFGEFGEERLQLVVAGHAWRHGLLKVDEYSNTAQKLVEYKQAITNDKRIGASTRNELNLLCQDNESTRIERAKIFRRIQRLWKMVVSECSHLEATQAFEAWEEMSSENKRVKLYTGLLKLFIISDEACAGIGQYHDPTKPVPALIDLLNKIKEASLDEIIASGRTVLDPSDNSYFTVAVNTQMAPVLPKGRTTSLGCSLRSLSRNVCLAPMSTEVGSGYHNLLGYQKDGLFNVMLIPFPSEIAHDAFEPSFDESNLSETDQKRRWRWFNVRQDWVPAINKRRERDKVLAYLINAITDGIKKCPEIHGVILPELALDFGLFKSLADKISQDVELHSVEVLIAGTSNADLKAGGKTVPKRGNFVCTAFFTTNAESKGVREYLLSIQRKHHRWKLTKEQIISYGSAFTLNPKFDWWENVNVAARQLNFWGFRDKSILATLICEDLARIDPSHQAIRAVGPSLVIALLMDGPQLRSRWSSLHASSLTSDPGCSVLSVTSLGLLKDRGHGGKFADSTNIALWSQAGSEPVEIKISEKSPGVILNLMGNECSTNSLDGRYQKNDARNWELVGVIDVK